MHNLNLNYNLMGFDSIEINLVFALKPCNQDGRFEYHKSHKQIGKNFQKLAVYLKNGLKKPKLRENLTWLGQTGIHLGMWGH